MIFQSTPQFICFMTSFYVLSPFWIGFSSSKQRSICSPFTAQPWGRKAFEEILTAKQHAWRLKEFPKWSPPLNALTTSLNGAPSILVEQLSLKACSESLSYIAVNSFSKSYIGASHKYCLSCRPFCILEIWPYVFIEEPSRATLTYHWNVDKSFAEYSLSSKYTKGEWSPSFTPYHVFFFLWIWITISGVSLCF